MGKWVIGILLVLAFAAIVALNQLDILSWQPLSMLVAALAAPFRLVLGAFTSKEDEIRKKHEKIRNAEADFQTDLASRIRERQQRIEALDEELEQVNDSISALKNKRARIDTEVDAMSSEELGDTVRGLLRSRRGT